MQQAGTLPHEEHLHLGLKPRPHVTLQQLDSPWASLGASAPREAKGKAISVPGPEGSWPEGGMQDTGGMVNLMKWSWEGSGPHVLTDETQEST